MERAEGAASEQVFRAAGVAYKAWFIADASACARCKMNEAQGAVPFDQPFSDGSYWVPGHVRCRCSCMAAPPPDAEKLARGRSVELNGQEYWPAGSYPHGPAMGGGGPMHAAHGPDGTQEYIPGGVPGMTAGGEPPRWAGSEVPAVVEDYEPGTGRPGGSQGGGTVGGPYRDRSDESTQLSPDDADDADWPEHRGVPGPPGDVLARAVHGRVLAARRHRDGAVTGDERGGRRAGAPPGPTGKGAADLSDPNPVEAEHVKNQLRKNFPEKALTWIDDVRWIGPVAIPLDRINFSDEESWAAHRQPEAVKRFAKKIRKGTGHTQPVIMVQKPGETKVEVVDGHHRTLAYRRLDRPVTAYVGFVPADKVSGTRRTPISFIRATAP